MIKKIVAFTLMVMFLMACGKKQDIGAEIQGKTYAYREKVVLEEENLEVVFTLGFKGDRINVVALNNFSSGYVIDGNGVTIMPMAGTLMAGPERLMDKEGQFLEDLRDTKGISLDNSTLTLTTKDGNELVFDEIK